MAMKLLRTLALLVMLMASAMAARDINKQGSFNEDKATIVGRRLFEISQGVGIDARINDRKPTGRHYYCPMLSPACT
ncbi:hypothetical protein IHE45_02G043600 [Dioscorea alata]|uniref:Uncharacterized protein n=1 Tax=Dioscorea alata TaxID=55571 RepID=A0ACB7WQK3_DIOAL|nr:hypothetical protein IHE45_02G043600 [Dioscorea alata]